MESSHHTVLLLAILVGVFLLLLAVLILLVCYCRKYIFKSNKNQTKALQFQDQTTSISTDSLTLPISKISSSCGLWHSQTLSPFSSKQDLFPKKGSHASTPMCSLTQAVPCTDATMETNDSNPGKYVSPMVPQQLIRKAMMRSQISVDKFRIRHDFSMLEHGLEKDNNLQISAADIREPLSSSINSTVDSNLLIASIEGPVLQVPASGGKQLRTSSLPQQLNYSALTSDRTSGQHMQWGILTSPCLAMTDKCLLTKDQQNGVWDQNQQKLMWLPVAFSKTGVQPESVSVPRMLSRSASCITLNLEVQGTSEASLVELPKDSSLVQPMVWSTSLGRKNLSDGSQNGKDPLNNVTSVDSGVNIVESQIYQEGKPETEKWQKASSPKEHHQDKTEDTRDHKEGSSCDSTTDKRLKAPLTEGKESEEDLKKLRGEKEEEKDSTVQKTITHEEAAMKLRRGDYGSKRSLWQKREERPLIAIN